MFFVRNKSGFTCDEIHLKSILNVVVGGGGCGGGGCGGGGVLSFVLLFCFFGTLEIICKRYHNNQYKQ